MNNNFCSSCGGTLTGGNNCPNCGAPVQQNVQMNNSGMNMNTNQNQMMNNGMNMNQNPNMMMNQVNATTNEKWTNTNAIWALVCEAISFFVFGFLAPVGLGLGIKSLNESKQHNNQGKVLSILAIVIGVIFSILYVIAVVNQK